MVEKMNKYELIEEAEEYYNYKKESEIIEKIAKRLQKIDELHQEIGSLEHEIDLLSDGKPISENGDVLTADTFNELRK